MAWFGFRQRGISLDNNYSRTSGSGGLEFGYSSMAYRENMPPDSTPEKQGITIETLIRPQFTGQPRFAVLLHMFDKVDERQIIIGQWDRSLVVLDSDDYSNRRRTPKIYVPLDVEETNSDLRIESDNEGTRVFVNGEMRGQNRNLIMDYPRNPGQTLLIMGNRIDAETPWSGTVYNLTISGSVTLPEENPHEPELEYSFVETADKFGGKDEYAGELIFPSKIRSLKKSVLEIPEYGMLGSGTMSSDIFFNYFGFIPLGFLIYANHPPKKRRKGISPLAASLLFPFLFSFAIEISQIWIPFRDSSLLDLILNSAGGLTGGLILRKIIKYSSIK